MKKMIKIIRVLVLIIVAGVAVYGAYLWFFLPQTGGTSVRNIASQAANMAATDAVQRADSAINASSPDSVQQGSATAVINSKSVNIVVPFTVQAPSGNWSDPIYQNGCEEASALMAMFWVQGKTSIDPNFANQEIKNISDYETKIFGSSADTNVDDTAAFIKGYFKYDKVDVRKNISSDDIIAELEKGNVVIVPMFGQALGNPHFTAPGPIEHMLVVTGYDALSKQFITNDPGTKFGQGYRYGVSTFMNATWMYPTSPQTVQYPGPANAQKAIIVVSK